MRAHRKRLTDNIFDAYPTLQMFRAAGNVETETGGKEIKEDLLYGTNSAEWFNDYDTLNTASDWIETILRDLEVRQKGETEGSSQEEDQSHRLSD